MAREPTSTLWSVFPISRDWSRSGIKSCNPKNQIRDHPEKWYLSQSGCGIKSGINTTFLARKMGSEKTLPLSVYKII